MARRHAVGAEHVGALVVAVDRPVGAIMLGHAPVAGGRGAAQDEVGDALGLDEEAAVAGRLEGRHQRFGEMHVGVLAAIVGERRPVVAEFLGARAVRLVPKARLENLGDVGEQRVGVRMADAFGARRRQQDEGVAIGELVALARAVVVERPEIAAVTWRRDGARESPSCRDRRCRRRRVGRADARWRSNGPCASSRAAAARARSPTADRARRDWRSRPTDRSGPARKTRAANRPRRRASGGGRGGRARTAEQRAGSWFGVSSATESVAFCCATPVPLSPHADSDERWGRREAEQSLWRGARQAGIRRR